MDPNDEMLSTTTRSIFLFFLYIYVPTTIVEERKKDNEVGVVVGIVSILTIGTETCMLLPKRLIEATGPISSKFS